MNLWHDISAGNVPDELNLIIEIPTGSQNKYELDKESGILKLDRVLYSPLHYPGDYGFIPQTLGEDGDALDGIALVNFPTYPGTLMAVRPLGMLNMIDQGERDEKILCVPVDDVRFEHMKDLSDVAQPVLDEIAHFFRVYKELEKKTVEINGWSDLEATKKVILAGIDRYNEKFSETKSE